MIEAPGGDEDYEHVNWAFEFDRGEDGQKFKDDEALDSDALLLGRVTYEGFAPAWPTMEGAVADKFNAMPKYVVSRTLVDPEWNNTTVLGSGKRLFDGDGKKTRMPLREARTVGDGLTILTYGPIG